MTLAAARPGWEPEPRMLVSEWADRYRNLAGKAAAEKGPWRTSRTPYLREIMDCLSPYNDTEKVVLMKGGQLGGTEALLNWLGSIIHLTPGPCLYVLPTVDVAKRVSKSRIAPMIEETPVLRALVQPSRARDSGNTVQVKEFRGGTLILTGANSAAGLSSMPIRFLECDEVDRFPGEIEDEGDPIELAEERTATFFNRKIAYVSTPTTRGVSRIEKEYLATDQRRYFLPCPHCGHLDYLTWSGFKDYLAQDDGGHHRIEWDEGNPESARMACGACGRPVGEQHKLGMLERGAWRPTAVGAPGVAGFHLSGLYSPWFSWSRRVRRFLVAKDDPVKLRSFVNMGLGETYEERGDSVEAGTIAGRAEGYAGTVPVGVGVLCAAVDVQGDRLEVVVKGYGAGEESWLLAWEQIHGDPGKEPVWYDLDRFLRQRFPHERGRPCAIECVAVDSGGHHTEQVYRFCKPRLARRVFAVKGGTVTGLPLVGRPSMHNRYRAKLFVLCTDTGKELVFSRLQIRPPATPQPTPGLMHFPAWVAEEPEYAAQLTAEKGVRRWKRGRGSVREWIKLRERNEALDLEVYCLAALYILGRPFIAGLGARAEQWARPVGEGVVGPIPRSSPEEPPPPVPGPLRRQRKNWVTGWK